MNTGDHMDLFSFLSNDTQKILEKALSQIPPNRFELLHLLSLDPHSFEADIVRATSKEISQQRFKKQAMLLCQTGIESFACPADCLFCSFGESNYQGKDWRICDKELERINQNIKNEGGVYAHFLLFMHSFDFNYVLKTVEATRTLLPKTTDIVINCGDIDFTQAQELKSAGVSGSYHVVRLGEGIDTALSKETRIASIDALKKAGIDWYTCCEPIGPEHSNEEIIDQILLAVEKECFQNAVMRRICVASSALAHKGEIDLLRSSQIVAVLTLAMMNNKELSSIAIHEPDLLGLSSGANCIYAEFGVNPRDTSTDTTQGRAYSPSQCKKMLLDTGFTSLMQVKSDNVNLWSVR